MLNRNFLPLFQYFRKEMKEQAAGHGGGHHIGHRFLEEGSICGEQGRQKDKSGEEYKFPESRAEECQLHFAEGCGLVHQRILHSQRVNHKGEPLNIRNGTAQNHRFVI